MRCALRCCPPWSALQVISENQDPDPTTPHAPDVDATPVGASAADTRALNTQRPPAMKLDPNKELDAAEVTVSSQAGDAVDGGDALEGHVAAANALVAEHAMALRVALAGATDSSAVPYPYAVDGVQGSAVGDAADAHETPA